MRKKSQGSQADPYIRYPLAFRPEECPSLAKIHAESEQFSGKVKERIMQACNAYDKEHKDIESLIRQLVQAMNQGNIPTAQTITEQLSQTVEGFTLKDFE